MNNKYNIDCKKCGANSMKSKYKMGTRLIETEGGEPVFTKDKKLIYFNPDEPTHKEGGVKAMVIKDGLYTPDQLLAINMRNKTKLFPEGSSIVTRENNASNKAINAYNEGNTDRLSSIIKSMPKDRAKYGKYSIKSYKVGTENISNNPTRGGLGYYTVSPEEIKARNEAEMSNYAKARGDFGDIQDSYESQKQYSDVYNDQKYSWLAQNKYSTNTQTPKSNKLNFNLKGFGNSIGRIGEVYGTTTPIWQNLYLGKQKPELQQRNYLNKIKLNDSYNIQPSLQNIEDTYANQAGVVNNQSGTLQNRRALTQSIYNQRRSAKNQLLSDKANYLTNLRNQEVTNNQNIDEKNLNLKNQYNMYDEMARAKVQDATSKAAQQTGAFTGDIVNHLNKYKQDDLNRKYINQYYDKLESGLSKYKSKKGKYNIKLK